MKRILRYPLHEVILSLLFNVATLWLWSFVNRGTHKEMIRENCKKYRYASYKSFKDELDFFSHWEYKERWPDSLFGANSYWEEWRIHCGIYMFDGMGYCLSTFGLFMARRATKKHIAKHYTQNKAILVR
jgi:hypothetical protein